MSQTTADLDPDAESRQEDGSLLERLRSMQSVWILGVLLVIVAVFGVLEPSTCSSRTTTW